MRVGVTAHFQFSMFSGGGASTTLSIAELLKMLGHDVYLVNLSTSQEWWDDMVSMKGMFPSVHIDSVKEPFDILFEVSNNVKDKETRQRVAKQSIWLVRKPQLLNDIECSIFPISMSRRNLEGLTAVWCLDQEIFDDEMQYLETLTRVPVSKVPFVWSPAMIEIYRREAGHPTWIQMAVAITQQQQKVLPWSVHVCETNNSASSSCTIPLVALRELKLQNEFQFNTYKIHNAQPVEHSDFFKHNVFAHCQVADLSGEFLGRQRVVDWAVDPMSCILSHMRFRRIRPYLLEALWCGIPLVHNSPLIKDLRCNYENYYYEDNSISGAAKAMTQLQRDLSLAKGMFQQGSHQSLQQKLIEKVTPASQTVQQGWRNAIQSLQGISVSPPPPPVQQKDETVIRVLFTDFWDDFNPEYNMFLLILQEGSKQLSPRPRIEGHTITSLEGKVPNLHIFGPFGSQWKQEAWSSVPKVHFTGENTPPVAHSSVFLNLGYPHADFVDERYIRLPLWMLEIDWFGADKERIVNPKPLPLDRCVKIYPEEISLKNRFCAFVVTNPCNPVRNSAFHWLNQYKKVDSAGRLFNNIGDEIFAGLGGGGGELKKHEFLKKYKFCLAYENASAQGYTTEKLLHAKVAGCIPIYWGDPKVERDFDTKGFIDARRFTTPEELIEAVRKVDNDPAEYLRIFATPALDEYKRDLVRRTFSQMAFMMLKAALPGQSIHQDKIPKFLGATSSAEAEALRLEREGGQKKVPEQFVEPSKPNPIILKSESKHPNTPMPKDPVFVTMATLRFLPSLHQLLAGLQVQQKVIDKLSIVVYLGTDVNDTILETLKNTFQLATFTRLPTETPDNFPDYWAPEHFAWKLWILQSISKDSSFANRLVIYLDSGIFVSRLPKTWLQITMEEGICLLEDPRQINKHWCHVDFCKALDVKAEELEKQQLWAGCIAFLHGHPTALRLFEEAYSWSKQRSVIVGPKWAGIENGHPIGHRHDQSILSILSARMNITRYPMDELYCNHSLRKTFLLGKPFYVHRGAFMVNKPFLTWIDEAFVINLDRRADRMEKLFTHNPELKDAVVRLSAYEGKNIQLTPAIARLFKPNDFFWKKPILGCALSHLQLWWQLAHEKPEINTYLIMEDDVKLKPGWQDRWKAAAGYVPEDADVVYLGGILPPNRQGFETVKEKVNEFFSRVAPNNFFGQNPSSPYFHWCNYAYILTRQGAQKILDILQDRDGYWTSADHMVCNRIDVLNHYFLDPLVAGCYQDDDPRYQTSQFNDFSRIDGFDSDLWNNDERFTAEEVQRCLAEAPSEIQIEKALQDGRIVSVPTTKPVEPIQENTIGKEEPNPQKMIQLLVSPPSKPKRRFVCIEEHKFDSVNAYEKEWIQELLGKDTPFLVETISWLGEPPTDSPIVIVQRPWMEKYAAMFQRWNEQGIDFFIFHVSDEFNTDSLSSYSLPHCKGIVRIYQRNDIPEEVKSKVTTIPLGYHWTMAYGSDDPLNKTPRLPFRNIVWSFYGTSWQERDMKLKPLEEIKPHSLRLVDKWESPEKITRSQYIAILLDSIFVPCPQGNNRETFRLYEALECGCIPLYIKGEETPDETLYVEWLQNEIGLLPLSSWSEAAILIQHFMNEKEVMESYRNALLIRWRTWKERLGNSVRKTWGL